MSRTDERQLVETLTREQKVAQLGSVWATVDASGMLVRNRSVPGADERTIQELIRDGIGQITRPFGSAPVDHAIAARAIEALQNELALPAIVHDECLSGFMAHGATAFGVPLNCGSSWDAELVELVAGAIGEQMSACGVHQGLAPLLDVVRDHRWGRVEECFGEDPYLVGVIGTAYVKGLESAGVIATPKHFVAYPSSEGGRNLAPAHVGVRELRDVLLPPFEMAIRLGQARALMESYQDIDGVPVAASEELLTGILREEWGFEGIVVSDYFAIEWLEQLHGVADGPAGSAALALRAGIDVELPNTRCYGAPLLEAMDSGLVTGADLDRSVERVLRIKHDLPVHSDPPPTLDSPEHRALARSLAERSIVLLQNDGTLPLRADARIALIGPIADSRNALLGNYSFTNHVADAPGGVEIVTVAQALGLPAIAGCDVVDDDTSGFAEAVAAARSADIAVVVVGDLAGNFKRGTSGEGTDTDDLRLPGVQEDLVTEIASSGTPTVVVLVSGRPYELERVAARASAVVAAWFPGEEGGNAIADILFGRLNPSGKTSLSFGRGAGQQPFTYHHKRLAQRGYARTSTRPVYPFGHGMSYTTFEYDALDVDEQVPTDGVLHVAFDVRNTGERAGEEVAQLYVRDVVASVTRPVLELKGFARVRLEPGESRRVEFSVHTDLLSFTGVDLRRIVEPGEVEVLVGSSSEDIRLRKNAEVVGPLRVVGPGRALMTDVSVSA